MSYVIIKKKEYKLKNRKDGTQYYVKDGKHRSLRKNQKVISRKTKPSGDLNQITISHPGSLAVLGYTTKSPLKVRRKALEKAVKKYGGLKVFRKLNAVYVLNSNRNPTLSEKFKRDRNWVKKNFSV